MALRATIDHETGSWPDGWSSQVANNGGSVAVGSAVGVRIEGTYYLACDVAGSSDDDAYAKQTDYSFTNTMAVGMWFRLDGGIGWDDGEDVRAFYMLQGTSGRVHVDIRKSGSDLQFGVRCRGDDGSWTGFSWSSTPIAIDTWYWVQITYVAGASAATATVYMDGAQVCQAVDSGHGGSAMSLNALWAGFSNPDAFYATMYLDYIMMGDVLADVPMPTSIPVFMHHYTQLRCA